MTKQHMTLKSTCREFNMAHSLCFYVFIQKKFFQTRCDNILQLAIIKGGKL